MRSVRERGCTRPVKRLVPGTTNKSFVIPFTPEKCVSGKDGQIHRPKDHIGFDKEGHDGGLRRPTTRRGPDPNDLFGARPS